jgi:cyclic pyranopterin phosphate synthase
MDAETAAAYGLAVRGDARSYGLFDRFGRPHTYLRISVTERCNLRCRYCMPEEGVQLFPKDHLLTFEEIERLATLFVRLGVRKIRLTGGEPLVRRGIDDLVARVGALKAHGLERLMMTSNALLLREHIPALLRAGMDAVNLSLDTLRPDRFRRIPAGGRSRGSCRMSIPPGRAARQGPATTGEAVSAAIHAAAHAGFRKVKVNAVVMKGVNDDEVVDLARAFARDLPIEMRFIEYMPFEGNGWGEELEMFPAASIRARLEEEVRLEPRGLNDAGAGTALIYDAFEKDGRPFRGQIGIISSMTEPFCGTCNRTRLTADGHFRWCLLDEGEIDLRAPLRSGATDDELALLIEEGLRRKRAGHAPADVLKESQKAAGPLHARSMIRIGG